jgi:hypothetical protein
MADSGSRLPPLLQKPPPLLQRLPPLLQRLPPLLQRLPPLVQGEMAFLAEVVRRCRDGTCAVVVLR